jgi:hypothetical protein
MTVKRLRGIEIDIFCPVRRNIITSLMKEYMRYIKITLNARLFILLMNKTPNIKGNIPEPVLVYSSNAWIALRFCYQK